MRFWLAGAIGILVPTFAVAQPAPRPVVGELFTSEGCSSCPPADANVAELARTRPDLLLLTFHVTYWNYLGWRDPYSFEAATQRQQRYVALGVSPEVYTPALIVDGKLDAVGSDGPAAGRWSSSATIACIRRLWAAGRTADAPSRRQISSARCRCSAPGQANRCVFKCQTQRDRRLPSSCSVMTDISSVPDLRVRHPTRRDPRNLVGSLRSLGGRTGSAHRASTPAFRSAHAIPPTESLTQ
jgi:hypothetical protein